MELLFDIDNSRSVLPVSWSGFSLNPKPHTGAQTCNLYIWEAKAGGLLMLTQVSVNLPVTSGQCSLSLKLASIQRSSKHLAVQGTAPSNLNKNWRFNWEGACL